MQIPPKEQDNTANKPDTVKQPISGSVGAVASGATAGMALGALTGVGGGGLPGIIVGSVMGGIAGAIAAEAAIETVTTQTPLHPQKDAESKK